MGLSQSETPAVHNLFVQYAPAVYRLALLSTRNHAEAEDIVQEVFSRIVKKWSSFRSESHVKTWIRHIAQNYLVDAARKRRKHQKAIESISIHYLPSQMDTLVEVEDILNALSEQQKAVIDLRIIKDLSVSDTAKILGCSEGKVRTDTHRALGRLKMFVKGEAQ